MLSSVESDEQQQPKRVRGQSCRYQSLTENYDSRGCEGLSPKDKLLYKINIITIVPMITIVIIFYSYSYCSYCYFIIYHYLQV